MKLLLQFVRYIEACVISPDWLDKLHAFFSATFLLTKENERFIFLGIFCNLLVQSFLNFQSRVVWLFCEDNQKWPKTKHCFDTFDTSLTVVIQMKGLNEKTKHLKTRVGMFLGWNIAGGNFLGGYFPGGNFRVGVFLIPLRLRATS